MVSIIIRTKNEERWISEVLRAVFSQDYRDFEVIIVDNKSTDKTLDKAKKFNVKVLTVDEYFPGKALNLGIKASKGEYIACLSAHCIPVNNKWLSTLLSNFTTDDVAGVYGRQEPMSFSSDFDKRDLLIAFGLDKKIQVNDSFFHNANSMVRRDLWQACSFDDTLSNIEDRAWAKQMLSKGYKIIYEPRASVYHYHGIHQSGNMERCAGVINVLKSIESLGPESDKRSQKIEEYDIAAFIPVSGEPKYLAGKPLIEYTIEHAKQSKYIKNTFILTDNHKIKKISERLGACVPFLRKPNEDGSLDETLQHSLERIESQGIFPDMVAVMWPTFPFREAGYIDKLIHELIAKGLDSVISVKPIFETCWQERQGGRYERIDSGNIPREFRKKMYIGVEGLGYVIYPDCMRKKKIYGDNIGILEVHNPISIIKVRDEEDFMLAEEIAKSWFANKRTA